MKAVLLKGLTRNGKRVPFAESGPTIIDLSDTEFTKLEARGVVREATKVDLRVADMDDTTATEVPEKPKRTKAAAAETKTSESEQKPDEDL